MNRLIIVGAGPAGLSLALLLARAGQPVTLLEASRDFARSLRGDALMPCGLEALARMGLWPLLERLPQRPLQDWQVWLEGRELFRVEEPMGALQPCRLVRQQDLLEALLQEALSLPHFDWQPAVTVRGLWPADGAQPHDGPGRQQRVRGVLLNDGRVLEGALVIGCDGRQSLVRRAAGLRLQPQGAPLDLLWLVLPDAGREEAGIPSGFLTLVGGGAIASACRGAGGELQLGWLLKPGEAIPQRSTSDWAEAIAALAPPDLAVLLRRRGAGLGHPQRFSVQVGMARQWQRPGVLLLGDAAHPMSPIRAQGINQALRDSLVAARELLAIAPLAGPGQGQPLADGGHQQRQLDQACRRIEALRRPEVVRLQSLQLAEARQGHWIGHNALVRHGLARLAPLLGPAARAVWTARQGPLRQGIAWL